MKLFANSNNASGLTNLMMGSNPLIQNAESMMQQIRDPKATFYEQARVRGINPEAAMAQLMQALK